MRFVARGVGNLARATSSVFWNPVFLGIALLTAGIGVAATTSSQGWRNVAWGLILAGAGIVAIAGILALRRRRQRDDTPEPLSGDAESKPPSPLLEIGRAHLPREAQFGSVEGFPIDRPARLIQVPVTNAQGAEQATEVFAELTFMPDDRQGSWSPREAATGEWVGDGQLATRITMPGNGQPHLLNVALVFNGGYPCIYEWTRRSRDANLHGYGMWSNGVDVDIAVRAAGPSVPSISRTLRIEVIDGLIHANWKGDSRSNWVGISGRGWPERHY